VASTIDGDLLVRGTAQFGGLLIPNNSVGDAQFKAADPLTAGKQQHQHAARFAQAGAAAAETRAAHHAHAAGTLYGVSVGSVAKAVGDSTATVDVRKNGTTVLSGTVTLNNANANYVAVPAGVGVAPYAAGDVFTVVVTVSAGTGTLPQGVFASLVLREAAD
jgi:hypothetical protein